MHVFLLSHEKIIRFNRSGLESSTRDKWLQNATKMTSQNFEARRPLITEVWRKLAFLRNKCRNTAKVSKDL